MLTPAAGGVVVLSSVERMDLAKVLSQLRQELADLDAAIASLEQFQLERPRRGRPPKGQAGLSRASSPDAAEVDVRSRDSA